MTKKHDDHEGEPIALVYDDADEGQLIAKCYTGEAAQNLADAWWTRVEWLQEVTDER